MRSARRAFVEAILLFSIFALLSKLKLHDQSFLILYVTDLCLRLYLQWCQVGAANAYLTMQLQCLICMTKNRTGVKNVVIGLVARFAVDGTSKARC